MATTKTKAKKATPKKTTAKKPSAKATKTATRSLKVNRIANKTVTNWSDRVFLRLALAVLVSSTTAWAVLGARLQQLNADQIVNSYLFTNWQTFHS
ncbi:MAG TPA: hypothetical protein VLF87_02325, partial [Patescibacteria group bacterium]|nr:hypothetical protein [Patescibacteria group bacterium]